MFLRTTAVVCAVAAKLLPQTTFLDRYRKFRARYGYDGNEIPVREDIQQKFQEVMEDMKLPQDKRYIKLFNVYDVEIFHAGAAWSKNGGIIGIPANFEYDDIDSVTEEKISFQNLPLWDIEAAEEFRQTLVLSENAQKFAIARKIYAITGFHLVYQSIAVALDTCLGLEFYYYFMDKKKIKPRSIQHIGLICTATLVTIILWLFSKHLLEDTTEQEINEKVIMLGPNYIEGGVEYYEKLKKRNKALRVILGDKGKYVFTNSGNKIPWFGQGNTSVTQQIDYFNARVQDFKLI